MTNLKEKVLKTLKSGKDIKAILEELLNCQEKLIKNYSNSVFSKDDKNIILKKYTELQNLGKSLYRYNLLTENNFNQEAQEEKAYIENIVLKGGISYYKYLWHSENSENTCDKCRKLDGKEFDFYDEVPNRPHPNCKCTVEIIKTNSIESNKIPDTEGNLPKKNPIENSKWEMPCNGPITSPYGWRIHPIHKTKKFHKGWDIGVPLGTPIKAIADGTVRYAGDNDPTGYGKYVIIDHGKINEKIVTSEYGHLSSWNVQTGQKVKQGQIIAKSGNTGSSSGPHLHVTIKENGQHVNPSIYIKY